MFLQVKKLNVFSRSHILNFTICFQVSFTRWLHDGGNEDGLGQRLWLICFHNFVIFVQRQPQLIKNKTSKFCLVYDFQTHLRIIYRQNVKNSHGTKQNLDWRLFWVPRRKPDKIYPRYPYQAAVVLRACPQVGNFSVKRVLDLFKLDHF